MSRLADRLERDLREIAAGAHPSPSAWDSIVARLGADEEHEVTLLVAPSPADRMRRVWFAAAAAAVALIAGSAVLVARDGDDSSVSTVADVTTSPTVAPTSTTGAVETTPPQPDPFVGSWVSTDSDGSAQTMEIVRVGANEYDVVLHDDAATDACAGAPATLAGTASAERGARLVMAQPELTCDDGTTPSLGPPPQAELADYAFDLDAASDVLVDRFGIVWRRAGAASETDGTIETTTTIAAEQTAVPPVGSTTSGGMWPQSTLDEVRAAQESVDAGDRAHAWQLFAQSDPSQAPWDAGIFTRFVEEGLGWEEYTPRLDALAYADGGGGYGELVVMRCAPGRTNPLAPYYADMPAEMRECAPTIDDLTYETVELSLIQPERRGPSGVWVVEAWEILQAPSEGPLFFRLYPDLGQVRQVVPPSTEEASAFLEAFLQARLDGQGAEAFLFPADSPGTDAPLLYETTNGVAYERFGTPRLVQGPVWPTGWWEYQVQLVAADETVVEQYFHVVRRDDGLGLIYGYAYEGEATTQDGRPVPVLQYHFNDRVAFTAPPTMSRRDGSEEVQLAGPGFDGRLILTLDPDPDRCADPPQTGEPVPPADAQAAARSILALPDVDVDGPLPISVAGTDGLQVDLTGSGRDACLGSSFWSDDLLADDAQWRMRIYLVDVPDGLFPSAGGWSPTVLAIAVVAARDDFGAVLAEATPVVESVEFRTG